MTTYEQAVITGMIAAPFLVLFTFVAFAKLWARKEAVNATGWVGLPEDVADDLATVDADMLEALNARGRA